MKTTPVKELMIPLADYATVSREATLREAVLALENAQLALDPSRHKHRAILVLDDTGKVISKLTMKDVLVAIEPNYGKMEGTDVLERSGFSPDMIKDMLEDNALWMEPLQFICERAAGQKLSNFIQPPSEDEYIDENATLAEAAHQLVVYPYQSLLVTRGEKVVGILRLSDLFSKICELMKNY